MPPISLRLRGDRSRHVCTVSFEWVIDRVSTNRYRSDIAGIQAILYGHYLNVVQVSSAFRVKLFFVHT